MMEIDKKEKKGTYGRYERDRTSLFVSRGGGDSIYPWVGRCGAAPHTLTLFKTNIADFPTLFKTEFRFLIPCLRHLTQFKTKFDKSIP